MMPEELLKNFEVLAEAQGGVDRLRSIILGLAMQGRLVPQSSQEEPAPVLLEKIAYERKQLAAELRLSKSLVSSPSIPPYPLPPTWAWTTASSIFHVITDGDHQAPPKSDKGVPFLVIGNVCTGRLNFEGTRFVPEGYYASLPEVRVPREGDLLYTVVGSYGVPVVVDVSRQFCVQRHIAILKPSLLVDVRYVCYAMKSPLAMAQATACATGTAQKTVPLGGLRKFLLPLPPAGEQRRIVAKVDQLMALCDELEARQAKKRETGTRLTQSALDALTSAQGPEEFAKAWQRVSGNFELFSAIPESVGMLRKSILKLVMLGRIVLQGSGGGDVSRLRAENGMARRALVARHGVKDGFDSEPIDQADVPYPLPLGWEWVRLGELGIFLGGGTPSKANTSFWQGSIPWVSPKDMKKPYIDDAQDHISEAAVQGSAVKLIPAGALLYVVRGMILAHTFPVARTQREVTINQDMKALVPAMPELGEFLLRACGALQEHILQKVTRSSHGTCRLESKELEQLLIPLPPLAEQKRIIAKVDQLMALCDALESKLSDAEQGAQRLAEAMAAEMVA